MTRYHSRKFILAVGVGLITSTFVALDIISPEIYRDIIMGTIAVYIAGNVWQKKGEA